MTLDPGPDPGKGKRLLGFLKNSAVRNRIYQPYAIRILLEQGKENNFSMEESKIVSKIKSLTLHKMKSPPTAKILKGYFDSLTSNAKYTWHTDLVFFNDDSDPHIWKLNTDEFEETPEEILEQCNIEIGKLHVKTLVDNESKPEVYFVIAGDGAGGTWYDEFVTNIQDPNSSLDWETAGVDYREHANFDLTSKSDDEIQKLSNGEQ